MLVPVLCRCLWLFIAIVCYFHRRSRCPLWRFHFTSVFRPRIVLSGQSHVTVIKFSCSEFPLSFSFMQLVRVATRFFFFFFFTTPKNARTCYFRYWNENEFRVDLNNINTWDVSRDDTLDTFSLDLFAFVFNNRSFSLPLVTSDSLCNRLSSGSYVIPIYTTIAITTTVHNNGRRYYGWRRTDRNDCSAFAAWSELHNYYSPERSLWYDDSWQNK